VETVESDSLERNGEKKMNSQCGYRGLGHYCTEGKVQFISRYRSTNDYCVDGRRVSVTDSGEIYHALAGDVERIYHFELVKHEEYLRWHAENVSWLKNEPSEFDAGIGKVVSA
jgi:hypothetical protein